MLLEGGRSKDKYRWLSNDVAVDPLRSLPVERIETTRDNIFPRVVERLRDGAVLVRPVGDEDLVGWASQENVNSPATVSRRVWLRTSSPKSMAEPPCVNLFVDPPRDHRAHVHCDFGDGDDLSPRACCHFEFLPFFESD